MAVGQSRMGVRETHRIQLFLFVVCLISFGAVLWSQMVSPADCLHTGGLTGCAGVTVTWKCG